MSVSFTLATVADDGVITHGVRCDCRDLFVTALGAAAGIHAATCWEWDAYMGYCEHAHDFVTATCGHRDHEMNVSNANAATILERLGFEVDHRYGIVGHADPADFLGRAMLAGIGVPDIGFPATVDQAPGRATMIDCGQRAGYITDAMTRLCEIATEALTRGCAIGWA